MQKKRFSLDDYAKNHPAGAIGKKLTMAVSDLMRTDTELPICPPATPLNDALVELSSKCLGCILIVKNQVLQGVFTDGDLRRALQKYDNHNILQMRVGDLMYTDFVSVRPDVLAVDALKCMEGEKKLTMLPVIANQTLVGLIHMHDILAAGL